MRSRLWQHESWPARTPFSFGRYLAPKMGKGEALAREIDAHVEEDYRTNL